MHVKTCFRMDRGLAARRDTDRHSSQIEYRRLCSGTTSIQTPIPFTQEIANRVQGFHQSAL